MGFGNDRTGHLPIFRRDATVAPEAMGQFFGATATLRRRFRFLSDPDAASEQRVLPGWSGCVLIRFFSVLYMLRVIGSRWLFRSDEPPAARSTF